MPGLGGAAVAATDMGAKFLGGGAGFMEKLFNNPLFLQFMSGVGADFMGNTPGRNLNAITQQNIASQNYMKLLQRMLAGDIPEGGKIVQSDTGMKIEVPKLKSEMGGYSNNAKAADEVGKAVSILSPFGGSQLSGADLAGLSPQDITQATQLQMTQEQIGQKKLTDLFDIMYKGGLLDYYQGQLASDAVNAQLRRDQEFRQWYELATKDERTELQKNYEAAVAEGYGGTLVDFKVLADDPETIKLYNASVKDGSFKGGLWDFIRKRAEAGRNIISLSPFERVLQTGEAEAINDVIAPDFAEKTKLGLMKEPRVWRSVTESTALAQERGISLEEARTLVQRAKVRQAMDTKIRQALLGQGVITRDSKGWYLNGKLVVKDPYATAK